MKPISKVASAIAHLNLFIRLTSARNIKSSVVKATQVF
jgi:hypothetical protein